jgi:hypothetical protein
VPAEAAAMAAPEGIAAAEDPEVVAVRMAVWESTGVTEYLAWRAATEPPEPTARREERVLVGHQVGRPVRLAPLGKEVLLILRLAQAGPVAQPRAAEVQELCSPTSMVHRTTEATAHRVQMAPRVRRPRRCPHQEEMEQRLRPDRSLDTHCLPPLLTI